MGRRFGRTHESYKMLAKAISKGKTVLVPVIDEAKAIEIQHKLLLDYDCNTIFIPAYRTTNILFIYDEYGQVVKIKSNNRVLGGFTFTQP